ncbi:MAG TPA: BtpA/SgcQ family protein [Spirochaetia bacterium]|nr:BtpA/SgcQ family protein [Spirochaetia bacterium]
MRSLPVFKKLPAVVGMVHLPPLPGSPRWGGDMQKVIDFAVRDARTLVEAGVDGVIVENINDFPFTRGSVEPITVAAMTVCVGEVRRAVGVAVGVNCLRNDGVSAVSIATATGAQFVRISNLTYAMVTDQGIIEGCAYEVSRLKSRINPGITIFSDVMVKHAFPIGPMDIGVVARDTAHRGGTNALVISGTETGAPINVDDLKTVRASLPDFPLASGSGVTPENLDEMLQYLDVVIVGTYFKEDGVLERPVDLKRARPLVQRVHAARK